MAEEAKEGRAVEMIYTNQHGARAIRRVIPKRIVFEKTDWSPKPQWLMEGYDLDRKADYFFAMKDINLWLGQLDADDATPSK